MRNPLRKRIAKEIRGEFGKYVALFLFLVITIGFVSGFLVAGGSMSTAYEESFERYNTEYGNLECADKLSSLQLKKLEQNVVRLYENFYIERKAKTQKTSTLRIFKIRENVNTVCVMRGRIPKGDGEIAIDRMYADNNHLEIGDHLKIGDERFKITGLVALPDYSALFASPSDLMFDSILFGVAVTTEENFNSLGIEGIHYSYSWKYPKEPKDEKEEKKWSDAFMKKVVTQVTLQQYLPRYLNQAIRFAGDDMGGDQTMLTVMLYILIVIIAFIFAISTTNTIHKEASIIGTLRASGYTRGELVRHYLAMPVIVTLFAALIGNLFGYTVFKNVAASLYYRSYSLTTYKTLWNGNAFMLTTLIPVLLMLVVNILILTIKMRIEPLRFLRRDFAKVKTKAMKLPNFHFITRFQLRILFQNVSSYITLFLGISFASVILLFGMMMSPLIEHYQSSILNNMIARYQYTLKMQVPTKTKGAEAYAVKTLKLNRKEGEEIGIYGVYKNSKYVNKSMPSHGVFISDGYAKKYLVKKGDTITLKEQYTDDTYKFKVQGVYDYPASLCVFLDKEEFCNVFDLDQGYFNGYFSDRKIKDIEGNLIVNTITKEELIKTTRQLTKSMGGMFRYVNVFSLALYMLLIYILSKMMIEKNTNAISMVKILGYDNQEIWKLYLQATSIVVFFSLILGTAISVLVIKAIYRPLMAGYSGWLPLYTPWYMYVEMLVLGIISYLVVQFLLYQKIKKVPMCEVLKNVE